MEFAFDIESKKHFLFIVDTDSYTGNFNRELCAYITGQVGECGIGVEKAEKAKSEIPKTVSEFESIILDVIDDGDERCYRPVKCFPNPKHDNKFYSVAIYFSSIPKPHLIDVMKERAGHISEIGLGEEGFEEKFKIEGYRLLEEFSLYKEHKIQR